jgi:magnesium transporter
MNIELIYKDRTVVRVQNLSEIPQDTTGILNIQFIGYNQAEIRLVEKQFGIDTTILDKGEDIEISSHYLENEQQIAINFSVPYFNADSKIGEEPVSFILKDSMLFSFANIDFEAFITEKQKQTYFEKFHSFRIPTDSYLLVMVGFFSDYFADLTEIVSKKIKVHYSEILTGSKFSEQELDKITTYSFNNLIIKESINEYRRILHLFRKSDKINAETKEAFYAELNDLAVINDYIQNNFERLDDLKENISSKIDLEQNRIFKTLTIVTMCISLPMLVAGIYGMNFKFMPELEWAFGYPYVLVLLALSFLLPLIWFKRKKWL